MNCGHGVVYRMFRNGGLRCAICDPPRLIPFKIGLLGDDGEIHTPADLRSETDSILQEGKEREAREFLRAFDGRWEVIHPEVGPDGWPLYSHEWKEYIKPTGLLKENPVLPR